MELPEISHVSERVRRRDGFALAMAVFLLFAVAIAGLTGYQVVSVEATLASGNRDAGSALTIANGGCSATWRSVSVNSVQIRT